MLRGFYSAPEEWDLVVLDFDLSWHRGAQEKSVVHTPAVACYLAPEQVKRSTKTSTRHAAVDSFGFGMTLYFMMSGVEPVAEQHLHRDWKEKTEAACLRWKCECWQSLPIRFARLLMNCTRDAQAQRWDMSQVEGELTRLREAYMRPSSVESAELLAEEIAFRSSESKMYDWDPGKLCAQSHLPTGVQFSVSGDESDRLVRLSAKRLDTRDHEYRKVKKWLDKNAPAIRDALKGCGWKIEQYDHGGSRISIEASLRVSDARSRLDEVVRCVDGVREKLRLE